MANNSKITGIRKKASSAVDKAEGTLQRILVVEGVQKSIRCYLEVL